jgi:hypothetical protein
VTNDGRSSHEVAPGVDAHEVLIEPPTQALWVSFGSLAFVAMGVALLMTGNGNTIMSILTIVFFGACFIIGIMMLFGPKATLSLDQEGFEFVTLGRVNREAWNEIEGFGVARIGLNRLVGINYPAEKLASLSPLVAQSAATSKSMCGYHGALPVTYGLRADVLAAKLNARLGEVKRNLDQG